MENNADEILTSSLNKPWESIPRSIKIYEKKKEEDTRENPKEQLEGCIGLYRCGGFSNLKREMMFVYVHFQLQEHHHRQEQRVQRFHPSIHLWLLLTRDINKHTIFGWLKNTKYPSLTVVDPFAPNISLKDQWTRICSNNYYYKSIKHNDTIFLRYKVINSYYTHTNSSVSHVFTSVNYCSPKHPHSIRLFFVLSRRDLYQLGVFHSDCFHKFLRKKVFFFLQRSADLGEMMAKPMNGFHFLNEKNLSFLGLMGPRHTLAYDFLPCAPIEREGKQPQRNENRWSRQRFFWTLTLVPWKKIHKQIVK